MREILFRGKRADNGEWVEGNLFIPDKKDTPTQICIGTNVVRITYDIIPESIGEFTSLTDKNGKKIFEGDIVKSDDLYGEPLSVIFNENCGTFQVLFKDGYSEDFLEQYTDVNHLEIIGNIHDNPELLKEREQNG